MQLDRTHVVIRLRSISEVGDLALVMVRRYPSALLIGFLAGALPWFIANAALLWWIPLREAQYGLDDPEAMTELGRYALWMATLVVLQTPAAGVFTTFYLGQAVFEQRPTWSSVFSEVRKQFATWFWSLGITRLAVPAMAFVLVLWGSPATPPIDIMVPIALLVIVTMMRGSRPFLPEIILLEQCPLRAKEPNTITVGQRSKSLHSPMAGELGGRFITISFLLFWAFLCIMFTLIWARGVLTGYWDWGLTTLLVLYPVALWSVSGFSVIVRLLNYLDTRIRLEGWEVELAIRAEAIRQFGSEASVPQTPAARGKP